MGRRAKEDETYCNVYKERILQNFGFLLNDHGYTIVFLKRKGRYKNDCVFGMECPGKPKFQFGGEYGPYVAVAAPETKYGLRDKDFLASWFLINRIDDYLSGRERKIKAEDFPDWDEKLGKLATKTKRLLPTLIEIFSSEDSVNKWRKGYADWSHRGIEEWKRKIDKK